MSVMSPLPSVANQARINRYYRRLQALIPIDQFPRDHDLRAAIGRAYQFSWRRGGRPDLRFSRPMRLEPPFVERRRNPENQGYTPTNLGGAVVILGGLILVLVVAEKAARSLGLMP